MTSTDNSLVEYLLCVWPVRFQAEPQENIRIDIMVEVLLSKARHIIQTNIYNNEFMLNYTSFLV